VSIFKHIAAGALALGLSGTPAVADIVVVVSPKSPITALSKSQMTDIFLGRATRFPNGLLAVPIDQVEGSAAREEFYTRFVGKSAAQMKAYWSKIIFTGRGQPPTEVSDSAAVKKRILENQAAIGYIDKNMADASVRVLLTP
jgi:ABC-type phosphate transport system substrate-binding protein